MQMNENDFLWIHIHVCLYITENTLFYKTLDVFAFVMIRINKKTACFSINFHVDIDMDA